MTKLLPLRRSQDIAEAEAGDVSFTGDLGRGLLEGWLFNGWKREGSSPGHQSGCAGPLLHSLQGSHLRWSTHDWLCVHTGHVR